MLPRYRIAVISHNRPQNVERTEYHLDNVVWYVGGGRDSQDEVDSYVAHGVKPENVVRGGGLVESRNKALLDAQVAGEDCVMVDDDLKSLRIAKSSNRKDSVPISLVDAVKEMQLVLYHETRGMFYLAGGAPIANEFYFNPNKPLSFKHFIISAIIYIRNGCNLMFDSDFKTKEDYDFTLQNIQKYGGAVRLNYLMADFQHYSNKGGVVDWRTDAIEAESVSKLKRKWHGHVRDNPRRKNEVLIKV